MGWIRNVATAPRPTPAQRLRALADRLDRLTFTSEMDERLTHTIANELRVEAEKLS